MTKISLLPGYQKIHTAIIALLEEARHTATRSVNSIMSATYWEIGRRIIEFEQGGAARAEYGATLIARLAEDLTMHSGRGFTKSNLWNMRAFYLTWPIEQILQTVSGESPKKKLLKKIHNKRILHIELSTLSKYFPLPWSAYVRLLSVKDPSARSFYETEAMRAGWSVRQLDRQISSLFYERTALSNNKVAMLKQGRKTPIDESITSDEAIKDPFVLEFLNLKDEYSETDLEAALIHRLEDFMLELGDDFAFIGRQRTYQSKKIIRKEKIRRESTCFPFNLTASASRLQISKYPLRLTHLNSPPFPA